MLEEHERGATKRPQQGCTAGRGDKVRARGLRGGVWLGSTERRNPLSSAQAGLSEGKSVVIASASPGRAGGAAAAQLSLFHRRSLRHAHRTGLLGQKRLLEATS